MRAIPQDLAASLLMCAGIVATWQGLSLLAVVPEYLAPAPHQVSTELWRAAVQGELLLHTGGTAQRWAPGFTAGALLGISFGLLSGTFRSLQAALELPVEFLRAIPVTALLPLFLVLFGAGDLCKVMMVLLPTALLAYLNTYYGVKHSTPERVMMAKAFGATKRTVFFQVIVPEALPGVFVGLRLALSLSLVVAVVVEMFAGADCGLGQRVYDSYLTNAIPTLYAYIVATGIIGYTLSQLLLICERKILFWSGN